MNDCMTFPDTVEEFMEQYKVVDTEHIYTNGSEFVPIFRMKQWFGHLPSAQPERKDAIEKAVAVEAISDELMSRFDISATYAYEVAESAINRIEVMAKEIGKE